MKGLSVPWWIAGGWAIDLFVGRQTRPHGDCDIVVLRKDQIAVQRHLQGWQLYAADTSWGLRPCSADEFLPQRIHDIWCRRGWKEPWAFQLMLAEDLRDEWVFRRNPQIGGQISKLGTTDEQGIPYLVPEIQLLYKACPIPSDKDEADFAIATPLLGDSAGAWLLTALTQLYPAGHTWIEELRKTE